MRWNDESVAVRIYVLECLSLVLGMTTNKKLGQHWLKDRSLLESIADSAQITRTDTVLEVGPGLGTLTSSLVKRAKKVIAIEFDTELARKLPAQFPGTSLEVVEGDILKFDLKRLPTGYKVVANVPYYITQKIIENFLLTSHRPDSMTLLVQKEVAEKLTAEAGKLTAIAVKLQILYDVQLGTRVPKMYFTPPPKVDSQTIICKKRHVENNVDIDNKKLFRVVDAGFSAPRKKLRTALAGGLAMPKTAVEDLLLVAGVDPAVRASDVSIAKWRYILDQYDIYRST